MRCLQSGVPAEGVGSSAAVAEASARNSSPKRWLKSAQPQRADCTSEVGGKARTRLSSYSRPLLPAQQPCKRSAGFVSPSLP
eukprot:3289977-Pleurochrysis_carterae.AAC.1